LEGLVKTKERLGARTPHISIWCVSSRENLQELPDLLRLAADLGVPESALPELATLASRQWTAAFNPRPVGEADLLELYRRACT